MDTWVRLLPWPPLCRQRQIAGHYRHHCISGGNALSFPQGTLHLTGAAMFAPEIFGFPSSALWSLMQALLTPALGLPFST